MESETDAPTGDRPERSGGLLDPGGDRSLLVDAAIGAAVTVVLSFTFISPVIGGATAAYLHRGGSGLKTGALSGLLSTLPAFLGTFLFLSVLPFGALLVSPEAAGGAILFLLAATFLFLGVAAWTILLGALGGVVGELVAQEYPDPPW